MLTQNKHRLYCGQEGLFSPFWPPENLAGSCSDVYYMDVHTVSGCFILLTPLLSPTALSSLESSPAGSGFFRVFCWLALPTQFSFSCCIGGWLPTPAFHSFPFAFRLVKSASTGFVPCVYYIQWLCVSLFMFLLHCTACEILVPQPDMEPCPL